MDRCALCRDCDAPPGPGPRCAGCGGRRIVRHAELATLTIAHLDCDAFFATVETRDDPSLIGHPVIVGGGRRGVVAACNYVARAAGVRSAMPMFKALRLCPEARVIRPNMAKYVAASRDVRRHLLACTPLVAALSIDEAVLDLSGTEAVHGAPPALTVARAVRRIEAEVGITVSVGLAPNRFLAKVASELDKPRGYAVIGAAEAAEFLAPHPVTLVPGVGEAAARTLAAAGFRTLGQVQAAPPKEFARRFGAWGHWLWRLALGQDDRPVVPGRVAKSVSAETTFAQDLSARVDLEGSLWRVAERLAARLTEADLAAGALTLKLKRADFSVLTRAVPLPTPTRLAPRLFAAARPTLAALADGTPYRLLGLGVSDLRPGGQADPDDLLDPGAGRLRRLEEAIATVRRRLGPDSIGRGRGLPRG